MKFPASVRLKKDDSLEVWCRRIFIALALLLMFWTSTASIYWWSNHPDADAGDFPPIRALFFED